MSRLDCETSTEGTKMVVELAFSKYPSTCELETQHGVDVGATYTNENAIKTFCHFIAESQREELAESLSNAKFFSLLMDGSTDKGNIDDELLCCGVTLMELTRWFTLE